MCLVGRCQPDQGRAADGFDVDAVSTMRTILGVVRAMAAAGAQTGIRAHDEVSIQFGHLSRLHELLENPGMSDVDDRLLHVHRRLRETIADARRRRENYDIVEQRYQAERRRADDNAGNARGLERAFHLAVQWMDNPGPMGAWPITTWAIVGRFRRFESEKRLAFEEAMRRVERLRGAPLGDQPASMRIVVDATIDSVLAILREVGEVPTTPSTVGCVPLPMDGTPGPVVTADKAARASIESLLQRGLDVAADARAALLAFDSGSFVADDAETKAALGRTMTMHGIPEGEEGASIEDRIFAAASLLKAQAAEIDQANQALECYGVMREDHRTVGSRVHALAMNGWTREDGSSTGRIAPKAVVSRRMARRASSFDELTDLPPEPT